MSTQPARVKRDSSRDVQHEPATGNARSQGTSGMTRVLTIGLYIVACGLTGVGVDARAQTSDAGKLRQKLDEPASVLLERIEFPEAVISMSIEPHSTADSEKLVNALRR